MAARLRSVRAQPPVDRVPRRKARLLAESGRRVSGLLASDAGTAYNKCMQYTIRGIPEAVDAALRARARTTGTSLNEAAVDALVEGSGVTGRLRKRRDLGDIARTWKADKAVAAALADQDRVDEDLWR